MKSKNSTRLKRRNLPSWRRDSSRLRPSLKQSSKSVTLLIAPVLRTSANNFVASKRLWHCRLGGVHTASARRVKSWPRNVPKRPQRPRRRKVAKERKTEEKHPRSNRRMINPQSLHQLESRLDSDVLFMFYDLSIYVFVFKGYNILS